jgi:dipeptidyl aminopeptidase/acylaminoacyl peptidase
MSNFTNDSALSVPTSPRFPSSAMVAMGRRLAEARVRPDGEALGWVQRGAGSSELVTRHLGGPTGDGPELVLTTQPSILGPHADGGGAWCWTPDSSAVIYVAKDGLWMVSSAGGQPRRVVPSGDGRQLWSPCVSPDGSMVAFVDESEADVHVRVASLSDDWPSVRVSNDDAGFVVDPDWGSDGLLAWHAWSAPAMSWDRSWIDIVQVSVSAGSSRVNSIPVRRIEGGSVGQPRWNGKRLSWIDDSSGWGNVWVHSTANPADTAEDHGLVNEQAEHAGPTWGPGQRSTAWNPTGTEVAFERNEAGFGRLVIGSVERATEAAVVTLGRGVHRSLSWAVTNDGVHRIAAIRQGATTPIQVVVYERSNDPVATDDPVADDGTGWTRRSMARGPVAGWESVDLVEPTIVRWKSNGSDIPGRLYRPTAAAGPLPTVVSIHGGPTDQTRVGWNPRFAAYVAAGWQVFVPDHRGSTGWGREFQQAMTHGWGVVDVADTAAGVRHLIANGSADPTRIVVSGGSAGGFTALGLLAREPDLFAAGIVLYPVTDLIALDESTHRFEAHYNQTLVGSRSSDDQRYRDRSPVNLVDRITAPLVMFHGTEDRVVTIEQSDAFVQALRERGVAVHYIRFAGEGHGWSSPETTMTEHDQVMDFLGSIAVGGAAEASGSV